MCHLLHAQHWVILNQWAALGRAYLFWLVYSILVGEPSFRTDEYLLLSSCFSSSCQYLTDNITAEVYEQGNPGSSLPNVLLFAQKHLWGVCLWARLCAVSTTWFLKCLLPWLCSQPWGTDPPTEWSRDNTNQEHKVILQLAPLSHGLHIILSRAKAKRPSVYVAAFRWPCLVMAPLNNPSDETMVRSDTLSAEPPCGIWSSLSSKLSQHCRARGKTTNSQRACP